jgi:glycosyltransferase involved in cell wall biosynthesis
VSLRVLHLNTARGWRGGERQVFLLALALHRAGHRSVVAARPGEALARRLEDAGVPVLPCSPRFELDPLAAWRVRRFVRRDRIEIVHAHTAHSHALAALATAGGAARLVVTRRVDFRPRRNPVSRWKYRRADAVIAISKAVAQSLDPADVAVDRVHIVPSGIQLPPPPPPSPTGRSRAAASALGIAASAPLVVQAAALVQHKDPLMFLRAIKLTRELVPGVRALMVGDGYLRDAVERETDRLGLRDTVLLTGFRADAAALIEAADVVALSSEQEGLGTVILDAMARGVPVVATSAGGIPEIIDDGQNGFVVPVGDAQQFGERLARVLLNKPLAQQMGMRARQRAEEFSIERTVQGTLDVYTALMNRRDRIA